MSDPNCRGCRGTGVIRRPIPPTRWAGCIITEWCTPCGCGMIDTADFGPSLVRLARGGVPGPREG